jgi:drug/metabolite transporter (DMT)-like permease
VIAAYRLSLAALILLPFTLREVRTSTGKFGTHHRRLILLAGFFLAVHFASWITSLEFTNVASSVVFVQTSPLFVAILSPILLGERPTRSTLIGLGIAILGSLFIAISDMCPALRFSTCLSPLGSYNASAMLGNGLALLGAISGAGYLMIGRGIRRRLPLLPYITQVYAFAALILLILVAALRLPVTGFSREAYLWLFMLALFPQLIAHTSYNWALKYVSAALVSISLLGEPLAATILAYIILKEAPGIPVLIGGLLVLGGIILAVRKSAVEFESSSANPAIEAKKENRMQIRCFRCGWSFAIKKDEVAFAIEALKESGGNHHDARCPRCRHTNRVSLEQLRAAAPAPADKEKDRE